MRFSDLTAGYEFPSAALALDEATVLLYLAATDDDSAVYWQDDSSAPGGAPPSVSPGAPRLVPPLAVAALAFQGIAQGVALEAGTLHTGQEIAVRRPVRVGERLTARARVATSARRRDTTIVAIDTVIADDMAEEALSARMTILIAGAEASDDLAEAGGGGIVRPPDGRDSASVALQPTAYAPLDPAAIVAGAEIPPLTRVVTQEAIDRYARASGDYNPIHLDPAFAARTPFGGTIAHGMLLLASISTALTRAFGRAWLNTGTLKVRFRNPAPAGLSVTARGHVERVEEGDGVHYAVCPVLLESAAGDALITGEARVHITGPE